MFPKIRFTSITGAMLALFFAVIPVHAQGDAAPKARPIITENIDEGKMVDLKGNTREEANSDNDRGEVRNDLKMEHLLLQLRRSPQQEQDLQQYLNEQQQKGSPNFHRWLSAEEFGSRYGLAKQDIDMVTRWLESHGFKINVVYPSGMVIDFSGTAGDVHEAFKTEIHQYEVHGKRHIGNTKDPQVPAALASVVVGIVSLHDFRPQALYKMHGGKPGYTFNGSQGEAFALVPADLATIYNLNPLFGANTSGQGQTIVVIEDTDLYSASDWNAFRSTLGLSTYTSGSFTTSYPAPPSGTNNCSRPGVIAPNDGEAILDAEWASASAPSAAIVMATCADTTTTFGGLIALQNMINSSSQPPAIMSISYGQCETVNGAASNAAFNSAYQQAAAEGVSVFVAAGDSGAAGCDDNVSEATHGIDVNAFASTPYNVAVGGTDFSDTYSGTNSNYWSSTNSSSYGSALSYIPEIPWNDSCAGQLLSSYEKYATPYGTNGFCNSPLGGQLRSTVAGGGGPSGCATGTPTIAGDVGGSCLGWPKPSWQSVLGNPNDGVRDIPDVSLFAANGLWSHYYVFCWSDTGNGGAACSGAPGNWSGAGGTSFSSPIMAGIQALVNQQAGGPQGNPNIAYYQLAAMEYGSSGDSSCNSSSGFSVSSGCIFYDVTMGDMDVNCTGKVNCYKPSGTVGVLSTSNSSYKPAYGTAMGWDFATGIGSLNAANLVNNWPMPSPSYYLSASPGSLTLTQGSSGSSTITVNDLNGFSGNVSLAASGLPSGVTATFTPNQATTASTMTLTASSTATIGIYTITITGTSGSLTKTTSISLTINSVGSFTLSASPNSVSAVQGNSGATTITVTPLSGFNAGVTLSASGLPNGVTAIFNPNPATTTSTLTLLAASTASPGTSTITVTGLSGSLTSTATFSFTVTLSPTFSLSASPASVSVAQGASGTSTVSVTDLYGFTGNVSLSASGLPSGVTASFSPNPTTAASTLTLTASSTATIGSAPITVTGTSGSLTNTVAVSLSVTAAPNFSLAANPGTLNVTQGTSQSSTVTITGQNGFNGNVTFSVTGVPSGVTAFFNPNPAGTGSVLTVTAGSTAATGTATLTITGSSGSLTHTTSVGLTVLAGSNLTIPSGWSDNDIGTVGPAGSASFTNGTFTVKASGQAIWNNADSFNFAYQPLSGDGTIVARILNIQGGSTSESTGVMIRETLTAGSTNIYAGFSSGSLLYFDDRPSSGASTSSQNNGVAVALPYWVKVVRSGNNFTGYTSQDGANWVQLGTTVTVTMAQNVYVGLAVASDNNVALATAPFDNVSVSTPTAPAPVIASVSPTTGPVGTQVVISGTGFGTLQSGSMATLNGTLLTINSWSATSVTATIPSGAATGPLSVGIAPTLNSSNPVTFTVSASPLLTAWLDQDVGQVGVAGSASYANGTFTVNGSGAQVWGTADGLNYLYQPLSGDGTIIARLASLHGGQSLQSSGVMIRETLTAGSTNAYVGYGNGSYMYFDERLTTGGASTSASSASTVTLPYWAKLVRSGNTFTGYASADGVNWVQIGSSQTITMAQNVYVGLVANGDSTSTLATATFDNVSLSTPLTAAPVITSISPTSGPASSQVVISGSGFGASQGNSIATLNGAMLTVNSWSAVSVTVTLPAGANSGPLSVAVAPTMNSSNPLTFTVTAQPLLTVWRDQDIGSVGPAGSVAYGNGSFTVKASGQYVWSTADGFNFAYQPLSGDGTIVARMLSVQGGTSSESTGIMIRETLTAGSANIYAGFSTGSLLYFDDRPSTGASTSSQNNGSSVTLPYWMKVVRSGNSFTGFISQDGVNWVQVGTSVTVTMAQNVYVGLGVASDNNGALATATFDNVSVSTPTAPAPVISNISPSTGPIGTQVVITGSGFGTSQSSSNVILNGTSLTVSSWTATAVTVTIPSGATTGPLSIGVAPTMNSSNAATFTVSP